MNIGIIGQGFVGSAIRVGLKNHYKINTYDIDETKCNQTLEWVCLNSDIIFVCLPTPMRKDGSCDTRILEKAIEDIEETCLQGGRQESRPILIIKSTVTPGTTERIAHKYTDEGRKCNGHPVMPVCFSPEFLTEANSFEDFKNQTRIIIGGPIKVTSIIEQMFKQVFPATPIIKTRTKTAEMVKYFTNCFLATKVTFANQMYDICESGDIDYSKVCEYALYDERIGGSHLAVPGPDGDRGYGGHCFPKDLGAMSYFAKMLGVNKTLLTTIEEMNKYYRTNRDWENMKGRAVSDD
jgi:nucleotide sugar dehydrogenase